MKNEIKKFFPSDGLLRECIIASLTTNGPMTLQQLYASLPMHKRDYIFHELSSIPHVKDGGRVYYEGRDESQ